MYPAESRLGRSKRRASLSEFEVTTLARPRSSGLGRIGICRETIVPLVASIQPDPSTRIPPTPGSPACSPSMPVVSASRIRRLPRPCELPERSSIERRGRRRDRLVARCAARRRVAIVTLEAAATGATGLVRAAKRLLNSIRVRSAARRARRAFEARGYATTMRSVGRPAALASSRGCPARSALGGSSSVCRSGPSSSDSSPAARGRCSKRATAERELAADITVELRPPLVRAEVLLMVGAEAVLRVAVGPSRQEIDRQVAALKSAACSERPAPRSPIACRACSPAGGPASPTGRSSAACRERLRRATCRTPSSGECVDFLVDLHSVRGPGSRRGLVRRLAAVLAELCAPDHARGSATWAACSTAVLADLPRGFGHADFARGNLLAEGDRLVGSHRLGRGGTGRLPLLALLHLRLGADYDPQDDEWGQTSSLSSCRGRTRGATRLRVTIAAVSGSSRAQSFFARWHSRSGSTTSRSTFVCTLSGATIDAGSHETWMSVIRALAGLRQSFHDS